MDNNGSNYEDRDHGHSHRKHRHYHREERQRQDNDLLDGGRDFGSRHSRDEKHRDGKRRRYSVRDSPDDVEHRRERSKSYDRVEMGSAERDRDERHRERDRHRRSSRDSPHDEHHRERSRSYERGMRNSVEHEHASREESVERISSKKRKFKDSKNTDKSEERRFKDKVREVELGYQEEMKPQISITSMEKNDAAEKFDSKQKTVEKGTSRTLIEVEQQTVAGGDFSNTTMAFNHPQPSKVSTTSTVNENEGVSITRSDEVTGKFSADGAATSTAGRSNNLFLDALAKAKKALQMQKELSEKLKKIPLLNKVPGSSADASEPARLNSEAEAPSSVAGQGGSLASVATSQPTISAASVQPSSDSTTAIPGLTTLPNYEAVKRAQELAARMGFRHDPQFAPLINMFPGTVADISIPQKPSKAPVLRLDAQGREIDEHGNVISMTKPTSLSTLKVNINKQKKEAFQILKPELDIDAESNPHFDESMGINKTKILRPKRMNFQFVEEGKWSRQAEIIRFKSQFGEAQAKELKIKQAQLAKAKAEPDINPNLIEVSERVVKEKQKDPIPEIEWWDQPILLSGTYSDSADERLNMEKISMYIEHPLPIEPPAEPAPPPPQPLKLTKKEQKKLRTQRRLAKERDRQEMIRQGLIEPPKPKVKMSNLMKVLGSEATQDPTRLEMEIRSAAAEREQAHVDRNIARKLTPAERREKKERKLFEDPNTLETIVSVYKVNYLTHPKNRFRVDVNAQENRLTGCVVISEGVCVIVVEGCKKSNKRYKKLMLKRIDWAADVGDGDERPEALATTVNRCLLVWEGSVSKPNFNRFLIHQCRTEAAARKVFADAGVEHYWNLAANFSDEVI
uniref:U4/U6 small nuclear ribonucleoprotein Prp3 n=1 Tax=Anthurium amnicola TaxID=1678845 RepID=A0A1D1YS83_9ARAE